MKLEDLNEKPFNHKEKDEWFNNNDYILCVKDEAHPERNVINILYRNKDNNTVREIDNENTGDKTVATPNNRIEMSGIGERFSLHQFIKISYGNVVENERHYDNPSLPKVKTFHNNLRAVNNDDIIEIFDGSFDMPNAKIKIDDPFLNTLILDVYLGEDLFFFLDDGEKLIGPLRALKENSKNEIEVDVFHWRPFGYYKKTLNTFFEITINDIKRKIHIVGYNDFEIQSEIDFVTDEDLINKLKSLLENNSELVDNNKIEDYIDFTKSIINSDAFNKTIKYSDRLKEILLDKNKRLEESLNLLEDYKESNSDKSNDLEKIKLELENDIRNSERKKDELDQEVYAKKNELEKLKSSLDTEISNRRKEIEENINDLLIKKNNIDSEISKEKDEKSEELNRLETQIDYLREKENSLKLGIKTLKDEFTSEQKDTNEKLKELLKQNSHFNILSGIEVENPENESLKNPSKHVLEDNLVIDNYKIFRDQIQKELEKNNRIFKSHKLDNLLISIHQNSLTLLAGLPGTGKTSLVKLLTDIIAPKERTRLISVARGWTSQKDLIGFYNPLSRKFTASNTDFYDLLNQLDIETKSKEFFDNAPMAYVALDEANLSPLEHYWSSFYQLTDSIVSDDNYLKIEIGNRLKLNYPNNLRFIGTLNFDQTTESISPRIIDRSHIIRLKPSYDVNIDFLGNHEIKKVLTSYKKLREFFLLPDFNENTHKITFSEKNFEIFNELKEILRKINIYVSPRVQKDIKTYCYVAQKYMLEENKPMDYCISQRLLTKIDVHGEDAQKTLNELKSFLADYKLTISKEIVSDILKIGENNSFYKDTFNYFLTLNNV